MYAYIQLITGMVISPRQTLEQAVEEKKLFASLFIYVLSLIFALASEIMNSPGFVFLLFPLTAVFSLFLLLLSCGVSHLLAELLGGQGKAADLLLAFALCHVPLFFTAPLVLASSFDLAFLRLLVGAANFAFFIWYGYLAVQSLMIVEKLSLGKSLCILLLPLICLILFIVLLIALLLVGGTFLGLSTYLHSWIGELGL